jgi:2-keto-4-pentenoate hydratase/2-oxohepta-3-ene-1,7-dioic acid hydratase in catechol pathway
MKLGRISLSGPDGPTPRLVVVRPAEGRVIDLKKASTLHLQSRGATRSAALRLSEAHFPGSMSAAIASGERFLSDCETVCAHRADDASLPLDAVNWLPASDPSIVRDGLTFLKHIRQFHQKMNLQPKPALLEIPGYFKGSPHTCIGHDQEVVWPEYLQRMDYELELGWVIGREAHNVRPENARQYLFGVTIFNDFSGRDLQANEFAIGMGPTKCKDFAYGIGPWITTADEFKNLTEIQMRVRVNGEIWGEGDSSETLWSVDELIAWVSLDEYIQPGDVIGSGTMGNGSSLEVDRHLKPGDVIELEVDGIGTLRNRLAAQKAGGRWWPTKREPFM